MQLNKLLAGASLALFAAAAAAQAPSYGTNVTLEQAKKIAAASAAHAQKNRWPVAIAVADTHGTLVYFERLDETQIGSIQVAIDKARTAAIYKRPTRAFEEAVTKGNRNVIMTLAGATPVTGGVPIMVGGKIVGSVGVSGVTGDQDEEVAKAGVAGM